MAKTRPSSTKRRPAVRTKGRKAAKAAPATPPESEQRKVYEWLKAAHAGAGKWLDALCRRAGYCPVATGKDSDLVLVMARQLARGLGVSERTVRTWLKEGLPVYQEPSGNRAALYDVFEVLKWHYGRQMPRPQSEEDILFGDPSSKDYWTQQYRKEKTRQIKRENEVAEGTLLRADDIAEDLVAVGQVFRSEAEAIERAHGHNVGRDVRAMIERAEKRWRELHGDGSNGSAEC